MPINMSDYKVIYKDRVYNAVEVIPTWWNDSSADQDVQDQDFIKKPNFIDVWFVDEDGELAFIQDKSIEFKFVRR